MIVHGPNFKIYGLYDYKCILGELLMGQVEILTLIVDIIYDTTT